MSVGQGFWTGDFTKCESGGRDGNTTKKGAVGGFKPSF